MLLLHIIFQPPQELPQNEEYMQYKAYHDGLRPCIQFFGQEIRGSEDCLYLNVFIPTVSDQRVYRPQNNYRTSEFRNLELFHLNWRETTNVYSCEYLPHAVHRAYLKQTKGKHPFYYPFNMCMYSTYRNHTETRHFYPFWLTFTGVVSSRVVLT